MPPGVQPNELVVAIRADDDDGVAAGLAGPRGRARRAAVGGLGGWWLRRGPAAAHAGPRGPAPRTPRWRSSRCPASTPPSEAFDAIARGVSVMVFSDNVPVEDEVRLKDAAAAQDVLVMGPDCGTAVVGGVALGFANVVDRGPVGIVAASGTGAQQVMALLDAAGVGVSHCLGVGGRDLSSAVGGRSTRQALAALAADAATEAILVVSKPPAAEVLAELEAYAAGLGTPVHWATLGAGRPDLTERGRDVPGRARTRACRSGRPGGPIDRAGRDPPSL